MSTQQQQQQSLPPLLRSVVIVLSSLFIVPAVFSYFTIHSALSSQNVCHVGGAIVQTEISGSYVPLDDASYYWVRIPYSTRPLFFENKWNHVCWSMTTLSTTLLSPMIKHRREHKFRANHHHTTHTHTTTATIQWDQSHVVEQKKKSAQQTIKGSSRFYGNIDMDVLDLQNSQQHGNRWCLLPTLQQSYKKKTNEEEWDERIFGRNNNHDDDTNTKTTDWRICGQPQPSIISRHEEPPYFVELPLQPPQSGRWHSTTNNNEHADVQVQCHMSTQALPHLAAGRLAQNNHHDDVKNLWWERAEVLHNDWNIVNLPVTLMVVLWLVMSRIISTTTTNNHDNSSSSWNVIRGMQQHLQHSTWPALLWTILWLYVLGAGLEPLLGSTSYLAVHVTLLLAFSLLRSSSYMWTLFSLGVLLAQVQPTMSVGPIQIMSISVGVFSMSGLPWIIWGGASILTHKPNRHRRRRRRRHHSESNNNNNKESSNSRSDEHSKGSESSNDRTDQDDEETWKYSLGASLLFGWILSFRFALEVLAAPQWIIPTAMVAHLWYLQRQAKRAKRDETEHLRLLHPEVGGDDATIFTLDTEAVDDASLQILLPEEAMVFGMFSSVSAALGLMLLAVLVLLSGLLLDVSLFVGHLLVAVLCVGAQYHSSFAHDVRHHELHSLWNLYYMFGACVMIVSDVMTLCGWIQCHVLMAVVPPTIVTPIPSYWLVGSLLLVQCLAHFVALLTIALSLLEQLDTTTPGYVFWRLVQAVAEEARLWYYVFS